MKQPEDKGTIKKRRKKGKTKWIVAGGVVVVAIVAGVIFFQNGGGGSAMASTLPPMSATVSTGTISSSVIGTGTLTNEDSTDIEIPSGLEIETVYVESGDTVEIGQILATVTADSLAEALTSTQEDIASLDSRINDAVGTSSTEKVTSSVDGRVKKIYVSSGDDTAAAMLENKALMLISLDGKMAVNLETSAPVAVNDSVTVTLSGGSTVTGTVISAGGNSCKVTMTDKGPAYGEGVSVSAEDGTYIGSGNLYINQELKVVATTGKVKTVHVSENESISVDDKLVTLSGDFASAEYYSLVSQRKSLEDTLEKLLQISQSGGITASEGGIITAVNVSDGKTPTSQSSISTPAQSASVSTGGGIQLMSYSGSTEDTVTAATLTVPAGTALADIGAIAVEAPVTGGVPQRGIANTDTGPYTGEIQWNPAAEKFAENTTYAAQVKLTAKDGYYFDSNADNVKLTVEGAVISGTAVQEENGKSILTFTVTFPATAAPETEPQATDPQAVTDASAQASTGSMSSSLGSSNLGSSNSSTALSSTDSASSDSQSANSQTEDSSMITAFSVSSGESMKVSLSIDELDILSLSVGQKASITLDALPNKTFEGEITKVNSTGTSSGGVTKYTVEVTLPKSESMLAGMNASVTIITEEKEGVLTIPAAAVTERANHSFIYKEMDEETGTLSGLTEIETGMTDGTRIEVVSGLSEGDVIYYQVISSDSSDAAITMPEGFSGGATFSGGEMREFSGGGDSGNMPSRGGAMPGGGNE